MVRYGRPGLVTRLRPDGLPGFAQSATRRPVPTGRPLEPPLKIGEIAGQAPARDRSNPLPRPGFARA